MPRKPRFQLPGYPQHIIQRGNNRQPCFFAERDYRVYLEAVEQACRKYGCQVHAYVLMTNHVHLLATPAQNWSVSQLMQSVGRRYVRYVNREYRRSGTLWEGRYKASLIQAERYLFACSRYIELNPVRAGMVDHPGEYRWSSYQANAQGAVDKLIRYHAEYLALASDPDGRATNYHELFRHQLAPGLVDEMRKALNHELVAGSSQFKDGIEAATGRRVSLGEPGRPRKDEDSRLY